MTVTDKLLYASVKILAIAVQQYTMNSVPKVPGCKDYLGPQVRDILDDLQIDERIG